MTSYCGCCAVVRALNVGLVKGLKNLFHAELNLKLAAGLEIQLFCAGSIESFFEWPLTYFQVKRFDSCYKRSGLFTVASVAGNAIKSHR